MVPGSITVVGTTITGGQVHVERWDGAYDRMPGAPFPESGSVRYLGDLNGNGRVNALIASSDDNNLYCVEFGIGTSHPWTSTATPLSGQFVDRTMQPDNWEPNNTRETAYPLRDNSSYYYGTIRPVRRRFQLQSLTPLTPPDP